MLFVLVDSDTSTDTKMYNLLKVFYNNSFYNSRDPSKRRQKAVHCARRIEVLTWLRVFLHAQFNAFCSQMPSCAHN